MKVALTVLGEPVTHESAVRNLAEHIHARLKREERG